MTLTHLEHIPNAISVPNDLLYVLSTKVLVYGNINEFLFNFLKKKTLFTFVTIVQTYRIEHGQPLASPALPPTRPFGLPLPKPTSNTDTTPTGHFRVFNEVV